MYHTPVEVEGWPVNRSRDASLYLRPGQDTAIVGQRDLCQRVLDDEEPFLLVLVFSPPENFQARNIIRDSWGSWQRSLPGVRVAFLLGLSRDPRMQDRVLDESVQYRDVIQENFVDSYNNLTLKSLFMLKWVDIYCSESSTSPAFVMKTDEDTFVNLPRLHMLLQFMHSHHTIYPQKGFVFGALFCDAPPIRSKSSKFYAPRYLFPGKLYPAYVAGAGYVMSRAAISSLYHAALQLPIFHMEDIFVTGMSRRKAGVPVYNHQEFHYLMEDSFEPCAYTRLMVGHQIPAQDQAQVWRQLRQREFRCGVLAGSVLLRDVEWMKDDRCF